MKTRHSGLELLRLICIWGIVCMHIFGSFLSSATGSNQLYGVIINSVFNMGVSLFMLISGYFSMTFSLKKFVKLEIVIWVYSVFSYFITYMNSGLFDIDAPGRKATIIKTLFPVLTGRYWFMSSYMLLFCLSPFINIFTSRIEKVALLKIIIVLSFFFVVAPSFLVVEIMDDGGKGVVNMFLLYLCGRYLGLYSKDSYPRKNLAGIFVGIVGGTITINYFLTIIGSKEEGIFCLFGRDCSITIFLGSIFAFLLFREFRFYSGMVNRMAQSVIGVYLLEGAVRNVITEYILNLEAFGDSIYLPAYISGLALCVVAFCIVIDKIRNLLFGRIEDMIVNWVEKRVKIVAEHIDKGIS